MPISRNFNQFKEPRGFIKIIEFIIAILAFSTTAGYNSEFNLINIPRNCSAKAVLQNVKGTFSYSFSEFKIDSVYKCGTTVVESSRTESLPSSLKRSSRFFVFVGVISFLYCIFAVVCYVCFEDASNHGRGGRGRHLKSFAIVDFVLTALLALIWFGASFAWAAGLPTLEDKTDPDDECSKIGSSCSVADKPIYAGLIVSVVFGFLSFFLWGANLWFVYKETVRHRERGSDAAVSCRISF